MTHCFSKAVHVNAEKQRRTAALFKDYREAEARIGELSSLGIPGGYPEFRMAIAGRDRALRRWLRARDAERKAAVG